MRLADELGRRKSARGILRFSILEIPPRDGFRVRHFLRLERSDLLRAQGNIVDACIVHRPGKAGAIRRLQMPQPDQRRAVFAKLLRFIVLIARELFPIAIGGDFLSMVDNRDLHERVAVGGLRGIPRLIALGALVKITARHPFRCRDFTEDDAIEMAALIINGQDAAAALGEIFARGRAQATSVLSFSGKWLRRPCGKRSQGDQ